jgi:hypothetical protein
MIVEGRNRVPRSSEGGLSSHGRLYAGIRRFRGVSGACL